MISKLISRAAAASSSGVVFSSSNFPSENFSEIFERNCRAQGSAYDSKSSIPKTSIPARATGPASFEIIAAQPTLSAVA